MLLEGTFCEFSLAELIRMVVYSSVTGRLEIACDDTLGQIYARDGRIYHAAAGILSGSAAVNHMFERASGTFRFVAGEFVATVTISQDVWELITQGETRAQAWARVRHIIPSMNCVPILTGGKRDEPVQINETSWAILTWIDGDRSIEEIAESMGQEPIEVAEALVLLVQRGVAQIKAARLASPDVTGRGMTMRSPVHTPMRSSFGGNRETSLWQRLRAKGHPHN
jgi:hypothetical protein